MQKLGGNRPVLLPCSGIGRLHGIVRGLDAFFSREFSNKLDASHSQRPVAVVTADGTVVYDKGFGWQITWGRFVLRATPPSIDWRVFLKLLRALPPCKFWSVV